MLLNNLAQQFVVSFDYNTFYPDVEKTWMPLLKRMSMPFMSIEDFINFNIQSINFPSLNTQNVTQQIGQYQITKRGGKELDQVMDKTFQLTIKLTESYISYFICREQYEYFLKMVDVQELYFPPITITLLDDGGFETISYKYHQLTPTTLSDINLSYVARIGTYNSFTWGFTFNYFDMWYRDTNGKYIQISTTKQDKRIINPTKNILDKSNLHKK